MHHCFITDGQVIICLKFTYLGVVQQCIFETIHDVEDMHSRLMQTKFAFDQVVIDATTDQWRDRLRACVCVCVCVCVCAGGHFEHMLLNECSFI